MLNDIKLYEKIPKDNFPIRLLDYRRDLYRFPLHWHEHTEMHCIFGGNGLLRCGDKKLSLKTGDCVIINANELHEGLSGDCTYGCIIIPPSFMDDNLVLFETLINDAAVTDLFVKIFEAYRCLNNAEALAIKGYTYLLLSHLIKNYSAKSFTEGAYRQHFEKLGRVNEAIRYINENYSEPLTTAQLAELVHLSEGHFCHVFKEITGKRAKDYINSLRVKKAAELLISTDITVTEAAMQCGFYDANYFSRVFKSYTGASPITLRRSKKVRGAAAPL